MPLWKFTYAKVHASFRRYIPIALHSDAFTQGQHNAFWCYQRLVPTRHSYSTIMTITFSLGVWDPPAQGLSFFPYSSSIRAAVRFHNLGWDPMLAASWGAEPSNVVSGTTRAPENSKVKKTWRGWLWISSASFFQLGQEWIISVHFMWGRVTSVDWGNETDTSQFDTVWGSWGQSLYFLWEHLLQRSIALVFSASVQHLHR